MIIITRSRCTVKQLLPSFPLASAAAKNAFDSTLNRRENHINLTAFFISQAFD
jgi:hypothetical protein